MLSLMALVGRLIYLPDVDRVMFDDPRFAPTRIVNLAC